MLLVEKAQYLLHKPVIWLSKQMVQQNETGKLQIRVSPSARAYLDQRQAEEMQQGRARPSLTALIDQLIDTAKARRKAA